MITSREVSTMTQSGLIGNGLSHTSCKLRETPGWQAHSARVEYRSSWVLLTPLVCDIGKMKNGSGGGESNNVLFFRHLLRATPQKSPIPPLPNAPPAAPPASPALFTTCLAQ